MKRLILFGAPSPVNVLDDDYLNVVFPSYLSIPECRLILSLNRETYIHEHTEHVPSVDELIEK